MLNFTFRIRIGRPSGPQNAGEYVEYGDEISPEIREQNWRVCEISTIAMEASTKEAAFRSSAAQSGGYLYIIPLFIQPKERTVS